MDTKLQASYRRLIPRFAHMVTGAGSVAILVEDANKSAEWYRDVLGFEIVENEGHTVFVRPRGSRFLLHLCGKCYACSADLPGGRTGVWLYRGKVRMRKNGATEALIPANNPRKVKETYRELKAKRVKFSEGLTSMSWSKYAIPCDPDGNEFGIS